MPPPSAGTRWPAAPCRGWLAAVAGAAAPPAPAAVDRLLAAGGGSLAGALWRGRWLMRRARRLRPAGSGHTRGVLGRSLAPRRRGDPAAEIGALGPAPGLRGLARGLPAAALAALPAIRKQGVLLAVPPLAWPDAATAARFACTSPPPAGRTGIFARLSGAEVSGRRRTPYVQCDGAKIVPPIGRTT